MNDYSDITEIVRKYLIYKSATQNRSSKTVFQYYHDLCTFTRFMLLRTYPEKYSKTAFSEIPYSDGDDELLINVKSDDVFEFTYFCFDTLKNGVCARRRKISCLRSFYKYLCKNLKVINENPTDAIDLPSMPKKLPKFLTLDESIELLSSVEGNNAKRDYCIITLFLNCGMRVSELVGIDISDISNDFSSVTVTGKGSKERILYLNSACQKAITDYLEIRPKNPKFKDKNALFISRNNNRISVQAVQSLIKKHLKAAGLENRNMSVHKLRHTAATLMYRHGKTDVRVLKDILGHEQLSTTQIYTHVNDDMIRKAADDNPLANVSAKKSKSAKREE